VKSHRAALIGDDVETSPSSGSDDLQIVGCKRTQLRTFPSVDGTKGRSEKRMGAGLDLDEHYVVSIKADDVDLTIGKTKIST